VGGTVMQFGLTLKETHPQWLMAASLSSAVLCLALVFVFMCYPDTMRRTPLNYCLLLLFTLAESFLVGMACIQYTRESVLICLGITALVVFSLSLFACQTSYDFTGFGPYLFCALMVLVGFSFAMMSYLESEPMIEEEEILAIMIDSGSEEEYEEALEEGRPGRSHRCKLAVSLAMLLVASVAIVAGPVSGLFKKNKSLTPTVKTGKHMIGEFGLGAQNGAIASLAPPAPLSQSPMEDMQIPAKAAGSCSKVDETIMSNKTGTAEGSLGRTVYDCTIGSLSIVGLLDDNRFSQCLEERTKLSTSCGSCYAEYSKFCLTHCAFVCAPNWCSSSCLQCNSQYKPSLDSCVGFIVPPQLPCDSEVITARKLGETINPIAV